jgi:diacylglycerol kinase (ATP)
VRHLVGLAVNPTAGGGRGTAAGALTSRLLAETGIDVVPLQAGSATELVVRVSAAVAEGLDALVVVGGDGMAHLGTNLVAGTALPLGIVAAGTGNDVARSLGLSVGDLPAAAAAVAAAVRDGTARSVDAVRCTAQRDQASPRWFAGVLGAGFDALVNERANGWSWPRGRRRYDLAVLRELPVLRPREYVLELDGVRHELAAVLVAVANAPSYGGGLQVCPDALMDDGLLDVLVVGPLSRTRFVRLYPSVFAGRHLGQPEVQVLRARVVGVASPGIVGYADGERVGPLPLTCRAVPGALRVLGAAAGRPATAGVAPHG